jgi:hypothetical protein
MILMAVASVIAVVAMEILARWTRTH